MNTYHLTLMNDWKMWIFVELCDVYRVKKASREEQVPSALLGSENQDCQ